MPRPQKMRMVCCLPNRDRFGPLGSSIDATNIVKMTIDEYETIRLIDMDGLTQEECAEQMNVSRTTIQGIYDKARKKLAESLVNGKILWIEGGEYQICNGRRNRCGKGACWRNEYDRNLPREPETENNLETNRMENANENSNANK